MSDWFKRKMEEAEATPREYFPYLLLLILLAIVLYFIVRLF